jgi:hypothetical protein
MTEESLSSQDKRVLNFKRCTKCKHLLDRTQFDRRPEQKSGLRSDCKDCRRKRIRLRYPKVKDRLLPYGRRLRADLKMKAFKILSNEVKCTKCGCPVFRCLDINHMNGGGSKEGLKGEIMRRAIASGRRKTDDLNLLCKPCNIIDYVEREFGELGGRWEIRWIPG